MNWLRRHPRLVTATLVLGFLLIRAALFTFTTAGEYFLYRDYGEAARQTSLTELYRNLNVEYPHLAVAFGSAAAVVAEALPDSATRLVSLRPNKAEEPYILLGEAERTATDRYEVAFGLLIFAVDVACLGLIWLIARRAYPGEDRLVRQCRVAGYIIATGAIGLILFDRQDLVVGFIALSAIYAFTRGSPAIAYAVLALGTAYKLVPALLLPVFVFAAASVRAAPDARPGRFIRCVFLEAAIAAAILSLWPILTYAFGGGDRGFAYLTFHSARGLQLEAPLAWPVVLLDPETTVQHGYGGFNLTGELADLAAKLTGPAMMLAVGMAFLIAARGFWRYARRPNPPAPFPSEPNPPAPFPKREGGVLSFSPPLLGEGFKKLTPHVVVSLLLVWLAFLMTGKVGSPQFMLWVAPLVPLMPLRTLGERTWSGLILAVFILTTLIFPCRYLPDVIGPIVSLEPYTRRGPSAAGLFLLAAKSVTLGAATAWLAVSLWRAPRIDLPPSPTTPEPKP